MTRLAIAGLAAALLTLSAGCPERPKPKQRPPVAPPVVTEPDAQPPPEPPKPTPPVLEAFFPARRPNFGPAPRDGGPLRAPTASKLLAGVRGPELPDQGGRLDDEWILAQTPKRWRVTATAPTELKEVALIGPDGLPWPTRSTLERRGAQIVAEIQVSAPLATGGSYQLIVTATHATWRLPVSVAAGVDAPQPW